ncbi:MAG: ATP-binding protein, partial [Acetatifactor sp.]|nr:ATP-binding protein [Acetatifactor sp.]
LEGHRIRERQYVDSLADLDEAEWDNEGSSRQPDSEAAETLPQDRRKKGKGTRKAQTDGVQAGGRRAKWYGIRIRDNGRGIPQEEIDRITEPFYMVDKSRSRKEGGAGLGMSLCQRILQLHGGSWKMKSTLGEGTEILIRLPLTPPG